MDGVGATVATVERTGRLAATHRFLVSNQTIMHKLNCPTTHPNVSTCNSLTKDAFDPFWLGVQIGGG
jgi:hypothetical protein